MGLVVATRLMNVLSYQDRENQKQTHSSKPGCRDTLRNVAAGLYPASEKIKLNTCGNSDGPTTWEGEKTRMDDLVKSWMDDMRSQGYK